MKTRGIDTTPSATPSASASQQAGNGAHQAIDRISEALHPAVTRAASGAHQLVERISSTSDRVAAGLEKTASRLKDTEQRLVGASSSFVREHPLKSAGIALAAGFLVSQLVSSRKSSGSFEKR